MSKMFRILYLVWVFADYMSGCFGQVTIDTSPQNEALVQSGIVTLQCKLVQHDSLTTYIGWDECITKNDGTCRRISNDNNVVYEALGGDPVRGKRYSVTNPEPKQYNLMITGILPEDAGKYRCVSLNDNIIYKYAEIFILEAEPLCTRNTSNQVVQGDYVMMTCDQTYAGRWPPLMNWKVNGGHYVGNIINETVSTRIKQSIVIEVQPNNDGDVFSMDTNFAQPTDIEEHEASNAPAYTHSHPFDVLVVYYPPYSISLSPDRGSYQPGDTISCSAMAKPSAQYVWIDTNSTEVVSESSTLTIIESMLGYQTFLCRAYNQYGNDTVSIDFNVYTTTTTTTLPPTTTTVVDSTTALSSTDTLPGKVDCTNVTIALWVVSSLLLASVVANIVMLVLSRHQLKPGSSSQKTGPPRNDQDNDQIEPNYNSLRSRDPVLPSVYEGLYVT